MHAQSTQHTDINSSQNDLFGCKSMFIENVGQYGVYFENKVELGEIKFAYEGLDMPVLFTTKGIIFLHRRYVQKEEVKHEELSKPEDEYEFRTTKDEHITMLWHGINVNCNYTYSQDVVAYHTYGLIDGKARGYKKIVLSEIYDGIDLILSINANNINGFEYSFDIKAGADADQVQILLGGDLRKAKIDMDGNLLLQSNINTVIQYAPKTFYRGYSGSVGEDDMVASHFELRGKKELRFSLPNSYDNSRAITIDPFVTATSNLTGINNGIAKDVDYDYAGNVYVAGGGNGSAYKLAKFDANGALQWTFSGSLAIPSWSFGLYYGGWVVDKNTGAIYLGQGFAPGGGHRIIRLNAAGVYDNFITTANISFMENWKMVWSCNAGSPKILVAGGGTNSNNNFAVCTPPSTVITPLNVTGIPYSGGTGWAQDIVDAVIDPQDNSLYTIYGSLFGTPSLSNKIYKNTSPYSGASVAWNSPSGFTTVMEIANRPYLNTSEIDNSANIFAINSSYLFYWDGKNLKAFDKATGAGVGTPLTFGTAALMCGGIIADECNNIFIGYINGTIKALNFNGSIFNDNALADLSVPGFATSSVYDLAYDEAKKLLYASGNGFASSISLSSYNCLANTFSININSSCATLSATATLSPLPPPGSTVTYTLWNGAMQVGSNTTGIFTNLLPNVTYTINAVVNKSCGGVETITTFMLNGPSINNNIVSPTCSNSNGSITINASNGISPYTYSLNGGGYVSSNVFSNLAAGIYTMSVKDSSGCINSTIVNLFNSNGPSISTTKTDATCSLPTGTITVTSSGGVPPIQYSTNGINFQTNNFFTGLAPGTYTVTVKDFAGCTNVISVQIISGNAPTVTATPTSTYCNTANGSIMAFGAGGMAPLQYSINGNTFQSSNVFNSLPTGTYSVTVKDALGCLGVVSVTVANAAAPAVSVVAASSTCGSINGSITATGSGGVLPLLYSINGVNFQSSNFFGGLAPGTYIVTVKDANNCSSTAATTIVNTNAPTVTAISTNSACNGATGTITATGAGGTGLLQYSLNNVNFQTSNMFAGLAPGVYTIYVKDASGCMGANIVVVANSAAPTLSLAVTPTACGANSGVITATGTGGISPYQFKLNNGSFQLGTTFSGLATGTYTVTISDASGCTVSATCLITNPSNLGMSVSSIASSCAANTGTINIIGIGGSGAITFSLDSIVFQANGQFTNLASGNYIAYVKDATGCIVSKPIVVAKLAAPTVTSVVVNANCNSINGTITASGAGGTGPLQYSINGVNFFASGVFNGVAPATYTVTVKDSLGCTGTATATVINVGAGPVPSLTYTFDPANCGNNEGKIRDIFGVGGTPPYTFSLNGSAFVPKVLPNNEYLNLSPGTYILTVKDANGCTFSVTVVIIDEPAPTLNVTSTNTPCGASTGTIVATATGVNPPHRFNLTGIAPWLVSGTFTGLAAGTYTVYVKDDQDCITSKTIVIVNTGGPTVSATVTNGTCGLNNGQINATGAGGTGALQYSINNIAYQSSGLFTGLAAGTYTVYVRDATNCKGSAIVTITNPGGPTLTASSQPSTCGLANGQIIASGTGTAPVIYSINGTVFQSNGTFISLAAGAYTVIVGDGAGCTKSLAINIASIAKPIVSGFSVPTACNSASGVVILNGSAGTTPYTFNLNGGVYQSSNIFGNLNAGLYVANIKDANGCINTANITVNSANAPTLTLASTPATCLNANGTITAVASGGLAPITYSIDSGAFQGTGVFTGLAQGTHWVTVKDANGCSTSKAILITNAAVPQSITAIWVNTSCGLSNGSITLAATGGVAPLQYSINGTTWQTTTLFNAIAAGTYTVYVKDVNGCTKTTSISVVNLASPAVTAVSTPSSCITNDGTITSTGMGGTGALTYSKNGTLFQASPVFTNLAPGTYTITVKDTKGCTSTTSIVVGTVPGPVASATDTSSTCGAANIVANATSGSAPFTYSLNGGAYQTSNLFPCVSSGFYIITIKDANGCTDTVSIFIPGSPLPIDLVFFTAEKKNKSAWITWGAIENKMLSRYELEWSTSSSGFNTIAIEYPLFNPNSMAMHEFKHHAPIKGLNYYRLKMVDLDAKIKYSVLRQLNFSDQQTFLYNYDGSLQTIEYLGDKEKASGLELYDTSGKLVLEVKPGAQIKSIPVHHLPRGVYHIQTRNGSTIYSQVIVLY